MARKLSGAVLNDTNNLSHGQADMIDRILMGAERKSHYVTEESKKSTAYHEGGHALVAMHTPGAMPLHKVYVRITDDISQFSRLLGSIGKWASCGDRYLSGFES